ncbi:MAG: hypothetical protein FWC28_04875 [Proteobacteria bacterium]|nr:hypothetical protein [Cystobacterineae bacterium]MCL2259151.1 hypothetical protein [Cystobacterineae bacterium]MCL2314570.1 hypothetical protein [Pseudomonadota bacterium]
MKFSIMGGMRVASFPANVSAAPNAPAAAAANDCFVNNSAFVGRAQPKPLNPTGLSPLPLGSKLQIRESFNRLDTQLCFAWAREDFGLKAQLLQQRRTMEPKWREMDLGLPDKLLPTPALKSKKYTVELEIAKAQLQPHTQPTALQVELREVLERELARRIPGRRAEQSKENTRLQGLSNREFLKTYGTLAKQLYIRASLPATPYESLLSSWGKWQNCTQEAESRFGKAWLWQYV